MRQQLTLNMLVFSFLLAVTSQATGQQLDTLTTIDVPGATYTDVQGINPRGDMVGEYIAGGVTHGFLLRQGHFASIDVPGASLTFARGINARGDIVGLYTSVGVTHGFLLSGGLSLRLMSPARAALLRSGSTPAATS
jgi:hypothetical protein